MEHIKMEYMPCNSLDLRIIFSCCILIAIHTSNNYLTDRITQSKQ